MGSRRAEVDCKILPATAAFLFLVLQPHEESAVWFEPFCRRLGFHSADRSRLPGGPFRNDARASSKFGE